ncbi:hypothetical protein SUGI_0193820 [Cryptomeria japonica]|nr:hypothetical protein SUGI_0193820 [Cryptomeria japonica]
MMSGRIGEAYKGTKQHVELTAVQMQTVDQSWRSSWQDPHILVHGGYKLGEGKPQNRYNTRLSGIGIVLGSKAELSGQGFDPGRKPELKRRKYSHKPP